jgi:hypothetical protein
MTAEYVIAWRLAAPFHAHLASDGARTVDQSYLEKYRFPAGSSWGCVRDVGGASIAVAPSVKVSKHLLLGGSLSKTPSRLQ